MSTRSNSFGIIRQQESRKREDEKKTILKRILTIIFAFFVLSIPTLTARASEPRASGSGYVYGTGMENVKSGSNAWAGSNMQKECVRYYTEWPEGFEKQAIAATSVNESESYAGGKE